MAYLKAEAVVEPRATRANLGPLFDKGAMQLEEPHDKFVFKLEGEKLNFSYGGPFGEKIQRAYEKNPESDLGYQAIKRFEEVKGRKANLSITGIKGIPTGIGGLGSSAATRLAVLAGTFAIYGYGTPIDELYNLTRALEHHDDNSAGATHGGITYNLKRGVIKHHPMEQHCVILVYNLAARKKSTDIARVPVLETEPNRDVYVVHFVDAGVILSATGSLNATENDVKRVVEEVTKDSPAKIHMFSQNPEESTYVSILDQVLDRLNGEFKAIRRDSHERMKILRERIPRDRTHTMARADKGIYEPFRDFSDFEEYIARIGKYGGGVSVSGAGTTIAIDIDIDTSIESQLKGMEEETRQLYEERGLTRKDTQFLLTRVSDAPIYVQFDTFKEQPRTITVSEETFLNLGSRNGVKEENGNIVYA